MAFEDNVENSVLNFIQKVSSRLNRTTGDGTTTAVIIASCLFHKLKSIKEKNKISTRELTHHLEDIVEKVVRELKEASIPLVKGNDEENEIDWYGLLNVATISLNNDLSSAKVIVEAFKKIGPYGSIQIKKARGFDTGISFTSGMEIHNGMTLPVFMNNKETKSFECNGEVEIFLSEEILANYHIQDFSLLLQRSMQQNIPLVIIAPGYDDNFTSFLMSNKLQLKDKLNIVPIIISMRTSSDKEKMIDFASYIGCNPYSSERFSSLKSYIETSFKEENILGAVQEVIISENRSLFSGSCAKGSFYDSEKRVEELKAELKALEEKDCETLDNELDITKLKSRIRSLDGSGVATIYIGGDSEQEKKTKMFLYEDAASACKSALKFGVLPGGCLATIKILHNLLVKYIHDHKKIISERDSDLSYSKVQNYINILEEICFAYKLSYKLLLKDKDNSKYYNYINEYIEDDKVYDIVNNTSEVFSFNGKAISNVVCSAETDIEILRTAISIINLLVCSDAYISWRTIFESDI